MSFCTESLNCSYRVHDMIIVDRARTELNTQTPETHTVTSPLSNVLCTIVGNMDLQLVIIIAIVSFFTKFDIMIV
jgi:hypothetical protein